MKARTRPIAREPPLIPAKKPGKDRGEREPAEQVGRGPGRRRVLPRGDADGGEASSEADGNK